MRLTMVAMALRVAAPPVPLEATLRGVIGLFTCVYFGRSLGTIVFGILVRC